MTIIYSIARSVAKEEAINNVISGVVTAVDEKSKYTVSCGGFSIFAYSSMENILIGDSVKVLLEGGDESRAQIIGRSTKLQDAQIEVIMGNGDKSMSPITDNLITTDSEAYRRGSQELNKRYIIKGVYSLRDAFPDEGAEIRNGSFIMVSEGALYQAVLWVKSYQISLSITENSFSVLVDIVAEDYLDSGVTLDSDYRIVDPYYYRII